MCGCSTAACYWCTTGRRHTLVTLLPWRILGRLGLLVCMSSFILSCLLNAVLVGLFCLLDWLLCNNYIVTSFYNRVWHLIDLLYAYPNMRSLICRLFCYTWQLPSLTFFRTTRDKRDKVHKKMRHSGGRCINTMTLSV